ncbi:MAG TPA: 2-methylthioadenine synthetase, partial [Candidatus Bathyarchaeota archaeon]|nr:2-methylthioadenine synthetase [Candidatus Bathyarchaeota archaeon]
MTKVYIETYGCTLNQADSEIIVGILLKHGYEITLSIEDADVIIVNT